MAAECEDKKEESAAFDNFLTEVSEAYTFYPYIFNGLCFAGKEDRKARFCLD